MILGASPDTPAKQSRFRKKFTLPFTLLADENHAIAEAYGVWQLKSFMGRKYMGVERTTFLIDPTGHVARVFEKVKASGHASEVREALEALQG